MRDTGMLKCWIAKVYNETARAAEVDCAEVEPGRKGATAESLEDGGVLRQKRLTQVMCVVDGLNLFVFAVDMASRG